jgi:hypothetical protein
LVTLVGSSTKLLAQGIASLKDVLGDNMEAHLPRGCLARVTAKGGLISSDVTTELGLFTVNNIGGIV